MVTDDLSGHPDPLNGDVSQLQAPQSPLRVSHTHGQAPSQQPRLHDPPTLPHKGLAMSSQLGTGLGDHLSSIALGVAPELPPPPTVLMQALLQQTPMHQFLPGLASWGSNLPQAPPTTSPPPPLTLLHPSSTITSVLPHEHHTSRTFPPLKQVDLKYFQHTHTEWGDDDLTPHTAVSDLS